MTTKQRFIAEAKQESNTTTSIYRDLIKMLIPNPLELGNSNNQELAKTKPIVLAARGILSNFYFIFYLILISICCKDFIRSLRPEFADKKVGKCLTDLCSEARQAKWKTDPQFEFVVQGNKLTKPTEEENNTTTDNTTTNDTKKQNKKEKKNKKAKLESPKNPEQPAFNLNQMSHHQYQTQNQISQHQFSQYQQPSLFQQQMFNQQMFRNPIPQPNQPYFNQMFIATQPNLFNTQSIASPSSSSSSLSSASLASTITPASATSLTSTANMYSNINNNLDLDDDNTQTGAPTEY